MDSWRFNSVVTGFTSDESFSPADSFRTDQIGSMSWEIKPPFINENDRGLLPNEINGENQVSGDMGSPQLMRNTTLNPVMAKFQSSFCEENESISRVDLKFGRLIDQKEAQNSKPSKNLHSLSPSLVSMPLKWPREDGFGSLIPFCKVHGCNKNLGDCKEYHRRHKVCEAHAKTSKVIVNGIEQRFCQQCSRFHMLHEFDDTKRSCRKRLAGHNERRRKPRAYGRLLPSQNISVGGNKFKGSTGAILSSRIPNGLSSPPQQRYKTNERCERNLQDRMANDLQSISSVTDEPLNLESFSICNFERNHALDGIVNGYIGSSSSVSSGLSGIASRSATALSLLSSQSQSTCYSSIIQTSNSQSQSAVFPGSQYESAQDSVPLLQDDMNSILGFEGSSVNF